MTFIKAFQICLLAVFTALLFRSSSPITSLFVMWSWLVTMCFVVKDFIRVSFHNRMLTLSIGHPKQTNAPVLIAANAPERT